VVDRGVERAGGELVDDDQVAGGCMWKAVAQSTCTGSCTSMSGSTAITILGLRFEAMAASSAARASPA
jgi:hypothetical protein